MFSKFEVSPFWKPWTDGSEGVLIRGGLALIAIGTTGYILNKVLNGSTATVLFEENSATNDILANRPYSDTVKEHLRATYAHFAGGLMMTGSFAYLFYRAGWSKLLMKADPWKVFGGTLVFTFGSCFATQMIDQYKYPLWKYSAWTLFNSSFGLILSPLYHVDSTLLARAAILSTGVVGSISAVGMTTRRRQYLWLGAPLSKFSTDFSQSNFYGLVIGMSVACLASICPLILPATATEALSVSEFISLYGGLAIFSGILLVDTHKMITKAENAQDARSLSSIDESLDIYLDTINIFVRILALLGKDEKRKKKRSTATSRTN